MLICVTGSRGYIGTIVVDSLVKEGHEVDEIDLKIDRDYSYITSNAKVLVHLGAYTSVPESDINPDKYYTNNVMYYESFLRQNNFEYIIYASSNSIYDSNTKINPESVYGLTKLAGEYITRRRCPNYTILRFANPIGVNKELHKNMVEYMSSTEPRLSWILAKCIVKKKEFQLHDIPHMTRDFYPVFWISDSILFLIDSPHHGGTIHIGSGVDTEIERLVTIVCHDFGIKFTKINSPPGTSSGHESPRFDYSFLRSLLGFKWLNYKPIDYFKSSLKDCIELVESIKKD